MRDASEKSLVHYNTMLAAIAQCREVDEVKDVHDNALALECYCLQANNMKAERQATEFRLRAERR